MLTIKEKQEISGVGWFRNINGKKTVLSESLSAFSEKYFYVSPDFYQQLNFDSIKNLDVIRDILIIETSKGFLIEKFEIINEFPYPKNYDNNLIMLSDFHKIDYWYDEISNEVIIFEVDKKYYENDLNVFEFLIKNFDILDGEIKRKQTFNLYISGESLSSIDVLKMCQNPDTGLYNLTFMFDFNMAVLYLNYFKEWEIENSFFICPNQNFKFLLD
jgi:hypothetical protein